MMHLDGIEEEDKYILCEKCEMWNKANPDQTVHAEHHYNTECPWQKLLKVKEQTGRRIVDEALEKIQADMIRRLEI